MRKVVIIKGETLNRRYSGGLRVENYKESSIPRLIDEIQAEFPNDILKYTSKNYNYWYRFKVLTICIFLYITLIVFLVYLIVH